MDAGAAYIPWGQIPNDLDVIRAGGEAIIDESTLPAAALSAAQTKTVLAPVAPPEEERESTSLPGLGGIVNTSIPPHIALTGGALPPLQPGQILPVTQPNLSAPPPSATTAQLPAVSQPLQLPGQMPGQMPPGQVPPGQMPPGQMPPGQVPPGQVPGGQLPAGLPPGVQLLMQNARQMQGKLVVMYYVGQLK